MSEAINTREKEAKLPLRTPTRRYTEAILSEGKETDSSLTKIGLFSGVIENSKKILDAYSGVWLVAAFFGLWEALPRLGVVDQVYLPTFSTTIKTLITLLGSGKFLTDIGVSCLRALTGFALAALVAIPLGFLMGWYNRFEKYTDLFMQTLRNTSTFALFPVFLLIFGLGETSKIVFIFYAASWHMLINTINGVKNVDPIYIKAAKSMGVSDRDLFKKVILPASIPSIVAGARLGVKIAFMVVVAAEMIGAASGLGFFIQSSQYNFMIPQMYAGIVMLSLLGVSLNYILVWFEKKTTSWKGGLDQSING